MIYRARVKNGVAVLDENVTLPDGTWVHVEPVQTQRPETLAEKFQDVIGKAGAMPADFAENHDPLWATAEGRSVVGGQERERSPMRPLAPGSPA